MREVEDLLGPAYVDERVAAGDEWDAPLDMQDEVELSVRVMSASGEAIALPTDATLRPWAVVVPFALPGETVRARVYRHSRLHSHADLVRVETPNAALRDDGRVRCRYFGRCGGCQYQMLAYDTQLEWKRDVVVNAYRRFSDLPVATLPPILDTVPSPLQYGYRTKITPHFEAPPKKLQKAPPPPEEHAGQPSWLKIGFNEVNRRHPIDIEECPIASPVLNEALKLTRASIIHKIYTYKKGVSLILRDSLRIADPPPDPDEHVCVTDFKATVRERVGTRLFDYPAGSFFQNNNSVLVPLTSYVRDAIFPSPATTVPPTHLVDAYCGAGLFAITLADHFECVAGIELSADSIRSATHNAALNELPQGRCTFRAGDAADIFAAVADFPPARTALVIDPPRKGCSDDFLKQTLALRPQTIVYVSCNVHTQARDVGALVRGAQEDPKRGVYVVEGLRGFDLFPQTAHVEAVAVLRLVPTSA
ncbi:S-adenosyl-L-methionine-dependent methyltransferase [Vararia minispora EC-137]|uniref:S-adenosyl-L-methionine-dependent methyltransferase n=1 Tax=Vararia minispora EC-137 TaxID=1314806 RepID=A0ACB8QP51_9AGAM|nr:S-adenosyl-L-methionine-dependent methyltransferase [Vararia minispora EC-137]